MIARLLCRLIGHYRTFCDYLLPHQLTERDGLVAHPGYWCCARCGRYLGEETLYEPMD